MLHINNTDLEKLANSIRMLSADALNKSQNGHLGTPLGAADVIATLFANFMHFNPKDPTWANRDRFILSAGHACIMLYSTLHHLNYQEFSLDSIKNLRELHSITSGHPEINHKAGIEVTTGPLGQGVSMAVGMAISEKILHSKYPSIMHHKVYTLVGDGCLMEGVSYESLALAGQLNLSNLVVIYDSNNITIDGTFDLSSKENIALRMESMGFEVITIDGHNFSEINQAFNTSQSSSKPVFIIAHTKIAYKVPNKEGTPQAHGGPLSKEELLGLKDNLNWHYEPFSTPSEIKDIWNMVVQEKIKQYDIWTDTLNQDSKKEEFLDFTSNKTIDNSVKDLENIALQTFEDQPKIATRVASGKILEILCKNSPNLIGGSADLSASNNTINKFSQIINSTNYNGNYIHYGVREHAMGAIMNGIASYKNGLIPYGGTFLVFSDYMRPAIRLSALMEQQVIYVFTHDNISLGGDGPTHQPIEHIASLRLIPNVEVLRPCDLIETIECYKIALENKNKPTLMILGRDNVPTLRADYDTNNNKVKQGGYLLLNNENNSINLVSSGSELHLAMDVAKILNDKGIVTNVISMPSLNRFNKLSDTEKQNVLKKPQFNVVIEAGKLTGYQESLGGITYLYGIDSFGLSGKAEQVMDYFGMTVEKILKFVEEKYNKNNG
jgi:transketolase